MLLPIDLTGKVILDPSARPKKIDLVIEERSLFRIGVPIKIPACTLPGIYELTDDRLKVRFPIEVGGERPAAFDSPGDTLALTTLVKAPAGFKTFPDKVKVTVAKPKGLPALRTSFRTGYYAN